MPIETNHKALTRKLSIIVAEARSEKLLARVRFAVAFICAIFSLYLFAIHKISFAICSIQIGFLLFVCVYSGIFILETKKSSLQQYIAFLSSFFDVLIVSIFIWTFYLAGLPPQWIHLNFFPAYFIVIGFTALHNKETLSLFTGFLSVFLYCMLYILFFLPNNAQAENHLIMYTPGLVILSLSALLSALVSHNNLRLVKRIIDSEVRFDNLSNTIPLILFKIDKNGKFLWINSTSNDKSGFVYSKMIGRNIKDFIDDTEYFKFDGLPVKGTFKVKDINDKIDYVDCVIQADDENINSNELEGIMVDVTDREKAISQREEMEERLFQYKKMESLGTLASGMAHDFNNILQTVNDITDRVGDETSESQTRHGMELISDTLTDARFLISELLALGRKKPLNYYPLNIAHFLRDSVTLFRKQLGDLYEIKLDIRDESLCILGDTDYLKRVWQNIIGNAKDAMPEGGTIFIECFLMENDENDKSVVIRISDTGIGVPKSIIEKIFDPFFTTKKKGKGTGLGLALVRRIITLHKGHVFIEKADSNGTSFRIEIPECSKEPGDIDTKSVLINRLPTSLIVLDDDPKMRKILNFFLADLSYKTYEAATMEEGIKALKDHIKECKILLMDWKLGEKDPHQVITNFRKVKPDLIIIVVSGYQPRPKSIKQMRIFRWITKPYDKNRLDLEIQKALYLDQKN